MLLKFEDDDIKVSIGISDEDFYKVTKNNENDNPLQKELNNKLREIFEKIKDPHQREIFKCFPYWNLIRNKNNIGFNMNVELKDSVKNFIDSEFIQKDITEIMNKVDNKMEVE